MKQYPLFLFPVTVLVLTIIACSCCCYSCCGCDGRPDPRHRKSQVRPATHSWSDTTCYRGHAWTSWFSAMGMTFHSSPLKMAITVLMSMAKRTRNHSVEFLLSVSATTVTRKVKLLYHHCLPPLGQDGVGGHGHRLLRKETVFPKTALQLAQLRIPSGTRSHRAKQRPLTQPHEALAVLLTRRMVLGISKTHWHHWEVQLLRSSWIKVRPTAGDMFSWDTCWKQQMVDLSDPDVPAEALGTAGNNCPQCHFIDDTMMGNCQRTNQIMWKQNLCKQKDEGKRENLTNPMAYFDHSLLNMLPRHPLWFCSSAYCRWMFLQSMGAPGDEQIPILIWWICVPDSLHCVQFILVDMNMMPGLCLWACTEAFQRTDTWWEPPLQGMCAAADCSSGHSDRAEPRMGCWAGVNKHK